MMLKKVEHRDERVGGALRSARRSGIVRLIVVCLLSTTMLMIAPGSRGSASDDERIVASLDTEYQLAVKNNDADLMDRLLSDDFVLITGLGKTYTKADLLAEARSKRTTYGFQEDSSRTVRVWGDTAVVTALLRAKGTEDGKAFDYQLWFSDVYLRKPAGWRYVFAQASTRLPKNPE